MKSTELSVVVCSRDRAAHLRRFLAKFPADRMASSGDQLVLVNNGSTDETAALMSAYRRTAPCRVDVVWEPTPGLSRARNAGVAAADGKMLVFTDDDCCLGTDYLETVRREFDKGEFQFCGGRILIANPQDDRLTQNLRHDRKIIRSRKAVDTGVFQGCNLVVLREVFDRVGGFDVNFDTWSLRAEDIDFCAAALDAGFTGAHIPELVVYHHHGRKPGSAAIAVKRSNDYARGGYYTKWILRGRMGYARIWLRHALSLAKVRRTTRELLGGWRYWRGHTGLQAARRARG